MSSSDMALRRLRLAADIGGTFTNVAAFDERAHRLLLGKSPSTPRAMAEGIEASVAKAGTKFPEAGLFLRGSTGAINTVLERTRARTALVTTRGFRDLHEIGRINRADSYNLLFRKHLPLVPREHCDEVTERPMPMAGSADCPTKPNCMRWLTHWRAMESRRARSCSCIATATRRMSCARRRFCGVCRACSGSGRHHLHHGWDRDR
jgi:hypothetical protein